MNILMVTWNGGGNVQPFLGVGHELVQRGHRARFLGPAVWREPVEHDGIAFLPATSAGEMDPLKALAPDEAENALLSVFFDEGYAADVRDGLAQEPTDALVIDCFLVSAQIAAEAAGLPYALLVHMPLGWLVEDWDEDMLQPTNAARVRAGLAPIASAQQQWQRARRVLVATTPLLDSVPAHVTARLRIRHVGPIFEPSGESTLGERTGGGDPLVLVSFSTTAMNQEPVLRRIIEALATAPVHGLVTAGPAVLPSSLPSVANVAVEPWLQHAAVLQKAALLITHGGHGTVSRGLAFGVPILALPLGRDQHFNAERVQEIGAGISLPMDASPATIAAAVRRLLNDPNYKDAAHRAAASIRAAGPGAVNAADELEAML